MNFSAAREITASGEVIVSFLPVAAVLCPLAGSLLILIAGFFSTKIRNLIAILTTVVTFIIILLLYPLVQQGGVVIYQFTIRVMDYQPHFRADSFSFLFALIFAVSWLIITPYTTIYMDREHAQTRFYLFYIATLSYCLGIVLSGDLFSLLLFFELMTFSSYVLIVHRQTPEALSAAKLTIYMGVTGGLFLLLGIFILYWGAGTMDITPMLERILASGINPLNVFLLFFIGFSIKMAMVPLHFWLPRAYEASPCPVNAISSAVMLKAGAYGLIRVLLTILTPASQGTPLSAAQTLSNVGMAIIWLGLLTALTGAVLALLQDDAKRILGYSSISQIGYILLGIGIAVFMGYEKGAIGFAGAIFHILNHSVYKAGLFLIIGAIYIIALDLNICRIRGLLEKIPFIGVAFLVGFFGIAGVPGFNGYTSKTLLHHALVDAGKMGQMTGVMMVADKLFLLVNILTIVYFTRLFEGLFLGRSIKTGANTTYYRIPLLVKGTLAVFSLIIMGIGLFPNYVLERFIVPAMGEFNFDPVSLANIYRFNYWKWHDLRDPVIILILAAILYIVLDHLRAFNWKAPEWLSVEHLFYLQLRRFLLESCGVTTSVDSAVNRGYTKIGKLIVSICHSVSSFDASINLAYKKSGNMARRLVENTERADKVLIENYNKSGNIARRFAEKTYTMDEVEKSVKVGKLSDDGMEVEEKSLSLWERMRGHPSDWSINNLNFNSLLMALMLGLFLFILLYYSRKA